MAAVSPAHPEPTMIIFSMEEKELTTDSTDSTDKKDARPRRPCYSCENVHRLDRGNRECRIRRETARSRSAAHRPRNAGGGQRRGERLLPHRHRMQRFHARV